MRFLLLCGTDKYSLVPYSERTVSKVGLYSDFLVCHDYLKEHAVHGAV